jgi:4-amino-4-deoxy-L-arabinose transferase-like glycosyltransferase
MHEKVAELIRKNQILFSLIAIALALSSYNMFGYPMFHGDEGIYSQQAYSVANLSRLSYYTYFYDHPPIGWIQIALWFKLTGQYTFGEIINSTRVLMLLIHLISLVLLFSIILISTKNKTCAALGGIIYAASPFSIFYGRIGLLDNIMIVWLLAAIYFLINCQGRLLYVLASGTCFGIAVLSKEVALPLLPAFLYGIWVYVPNRRKFAYACWLFPSLSLISCYFLFALLKGELFPDGNSTSLVGSILWQSSRKGGLPWVENSDFMRVAKDWLAKDAFLIMAGSAATLYNLLRHQNRFVGLNALLSVLTISRGNQVFDFYIASIYPLLAINIAVALKPLFSRTYALVGTFLVGFILAVLYLELEAHHYVFKADVNVIQRQAVAWVRNNLPADSSIVIDDKIWPALQVPKRGQSYRNAHSHWKVARDPDIFQDFLRDDWRNIDYIVADQAMVDNFKADKSSSFQDSAGSAIRSIAVEAFLNSIEVAYFETPNADAKHSLSILKVNSSGRLE